MRIVPAIDLIDGKVVRLSKGDYSERTGYGLTPLDAAKAFEDGGLEYLHLVDLDAAKGDGNNIKVLEKIASETSLIIDYGGGIRELEDLKRALDAGASKVNIGSSAVKKEREVKAWGISYPDRIILSADVRGEKIAVSGWLEATDIELIPFLSSYLADGIDSAAVTDIERDGMLSGPSLELYRKIIERVPKIKLIASGGVSSLEDLKALSAIGCDAAIVGKAYYEGRITIKEMKEAECFPRE